MLHSHTEEMIGGRHVAAIAISKHGVHLIRVYKYTLNCYELAMPNNNLLPGT